MVIILLTEGYFYEKQGEKTRCLLCPHHCTIAPDKFGICSVRTNTDGILQTINYGEVTSLALDPIEKKPLYHFHPGKNILSVGTFGVIFPVHFARITLSLISGLGVKGYHPKGLLRCAGRLRIT